MCVMATFTTKQQKFINAYMGPGNLNPTEAARIAGYAEGGIWVTSSQLLRNPKVAAEINRLMEEDPLVMGRAERVRFYASMARDPSEKSADRIKAADSLSRIAGDFIDNKVVTVRKETHPLEEFLTLKKAQTN